MNKIILSILICASFASCSTMNQVDTIIHNGNIYTVDSSFSIAQAMAINKGKIVGIGSDDSILGAFKGKEEINLENKSVYPGFIDAHCHFYGYGMGLQKCDLVGTKSYSEVLKRLVDFKNENHPDWLLGRGWDQNDWEVNEFPDNKELDSLFPNIPVYITRVDGHAAIANSIALIRAKIDKKTNVSGGRIGTNNEGNPSGLLVDNAMDMVKKVIPGPTSKQIEKGLVDAQNNCFQVGLTSVQDAGLEKNVVDEIDKLQKAQKLQMRVYAMLSDSKTNFDFYLKHGVYKTDFLNVRSFKCYADGALGSRGACLLKPYEDIPTQQGFLLSQPKYFDSIALILSNTKFQLCTHAIGDSANRIILNTYGKYLKSENNKRWRIEHCQVINKDDFDKFGKYSILPSVQPTHATSDMPWAYKRIGLERLKGAYAYKDLMKQNGILPCGSDFPVEDINPLYGFFAAVNRTDKDGNPSGGFQSENALTREESLKGMTIWAAYAAFEENEKGSLETGKFADFVILDEDLLKVEMMKIPTLKVKQTWVGGKQVYKFNKNE